MRKATRRLGQLYDDILKPSGLRATQYVILARVNAVPGRTMRELADDLVMDLSALGHTLKPLIRDGFLELVVDERDRRAKIVCLTPAGRNKYTETKRFWREAQSRFETVCGVDAAAQLRASSAFLASQEFADAFTRREPLSLPWR